MHPSVIKVQKKNPGNFWWSTTMLDRRRSVSVAGDGIEIPWTQWKWVPLVWLKYQIMIIILVGKCDTKGWKILRESLSKNQPFLAQGVPIKSVDSNSSIKSDRLTALKPGIRNSKLSNVGSTNGSKLSLKTPIKSPRTSRQNLRSS